MNIDITADVIEGAKKAVQSADFNKFIQKFTKEFQKAIDGEYEKILLEAIRTGSGWLWSYLSQIISDATYVAVYNRYFNNMTGEPNIYKRRYKNGGLADPNNIRLYLEDGQIVAENITRGKNENIKLEDIILTGGPYNYREGKNTTGTFRQPRNFYYTAQRYYKEDYVQEKLNAILQSRAQKIADEVMRKIS